MADPALSLVEISKSYGEVEVLHHINLDAAPGEFVVLLGPSGCGKSTLLKLIAGLEESTSGEIYVDNELVSYVRPRDRNVAMVFQNYALYPHMTVSKNIAFPLTMEKRPRVSKVEIDRRVGEAADIVGLSDYLDRKPAQLSGGQRQRVALARAIVRDPSVFLMDEPLSNLDAILRADMRRSLLDLHERMGRATIYVTHDQIEAMTMADRVVVMNTGAVQQIGPPHELFTTPANTFVAEFIGAPRMPLLDGLVEPEGTISVGGLLFTPEPSTAVVPGDGVIIGLRPTELSLWESDGENRVEGSVVRRDYIGSDSFLDVDLGSGIVVIARATAETPMRAGDTVYVEIPKNAAHVFDSQGIRLGSARFDGEPKPHG